MNRYVLDHGADAAAFLLDQLVHTIHGAFGHEHHAGATHHAEQQILGLGIHGGRFFLDDPTALQGGQCRAGGTGLTLDARERGSFGSPRQQDHGGENAERNADEQPREPVAEQHTDEQEHQQHTKTQQDHPEQDVRLPLLGHLEDLLHLGEDARALRRFTFALVLALTFALGRAGSG